MSWKTYAGLKAPLCVVCCTAPGCQLLLPNTILGDDPTPYANATDAAAAITDRVAGCLIAYQAGKDMTGITAAIVSGALHVSDPDTTFGDVSGAFAAPLSLAAGDLAVAYSLTFNISVDGTVDAGLYDSTGSFVTGAAAPPTTDLPPGTLNLTVPTAGCYFLVIQYNPFGPVPPFVTLAATFGISNSALAAGTIGADWDDGTDTGTVICT